LKNVDKLKEAFAELVEGFSPAPTPETLFDGLDTVF
jgi:hypothetical protein